MLIVAIFTKLFLVVVLDKIIRKEKDISPRNQFYVNSISCWMCNLNSLNDVCVLFIFVEGQGELPESKYLRVENKVFYFDVGSNRRGVYLRISEVCLK